MACQKLVLHRVSLSHDFCLTLSQKTAPGSIWDPQHTHLGISSFPKLGVSFGLFMAGVRVHLLPSFFTVSQFSVQSFRVTLPFRVLFET